MGDVIIVGAGVAGLAAAEALSAEHLSVTILEGRPSIGGRIHTLPAAGSERPPIELGAEFIHGAENNLWPTLAAGNLETHELPDRHWQPHNGVFIENTHFWERLDEVISKIDPDGPDMDFHSFLQNTPGISAEARKLARAFVEGFHAAPADRLSILSLAQSVAASEVQEGTRQFRISRGYGKLIDWFADRVRSPEVSLLCNRVVNRIEWEPGQAVAIAQAPDGPETFTASRIVVTVPLGVLKNGGKPGGMTFDPVLEEKQKAIDSLEMGLVMKVIFQFRSPVWPIENFGFIHAPDEWLPTWWSHGQAPILTGWAGGPRAEWLARENRETIIAAGLETLSHLFKLKPDRLQELLVGSWFHDWNRDPLARGAYSYAPVGRIGAPAQLAATVADTIFFAGEATNCDGDQGTVHGAVATGRRAARQILASMSARAPAYR